MLPFFESADAFLFLFRIKDIFDPSAYRALIHVNQLNRWFCVEREDRREGLTSPYRLRRDVDAKKSQPHVQHREVQMEAAKVCV